MVGDFFWLLVKKPTIDYDELLGKAKYINVKEIQRVRKSALDMVGLLTNRSERKVLPPISQNGITRLFFNYTPRKGVGKKTVQVFEGSRVLRSSGAMQEGPLLKR